MKNLTLNDIHVELGGKIVPFAGFNMPVSYEGVNAEHKAVREDVGIFDVSHMGEFFVEGPEALNLIQKISTNDASKLKDGDAQYSCMPNNNGGIVDDLLVYKFRDNNYMLVVNASNLQKDLEWINSNNNFDAKVTNRSDEYSLFAIQGPKSINTLQSLTSVNLSDVAYYKFKVDEFAGCKDVIISATGYTGSGGFEIYCKNEDAISIWKSILESGKEFGIKPIGLAARDTLRLEMGYCLYGNDINDETSPIQAGLSWVTKFSKDFINYENIKAEKEAGPTQKLIGFELTEKGIPRKDYIIKNSNEEEIGIVTSGTMSPSIGKAIGLGYVKSGFSNLETEVFIQIRKKLVKAKIVKLPFYKS